MTQEKHTQRAERGGVGLGIAGLGALTLTGALLFTSRSEGLAPSEGDPAVTSPPPGSSAREIPEQSAALAPVPVRVEPFTGEPRFERIEAPTTRPPKLDPCSDRALAEATFSQALQLLRCSDPEIVKLARSFLNEAAPSSAAGIPEHAQAIILEAKQAAFNDALTDLRKELGDLQLRSPNAFIHNKDLPASYVATRFEVHTDEFGERKAMIVNYSGSVGRGFTIPTSEAGRQLALQKIMLDGDSVDPAWFSLLLPKDR
jgi:hypothetical protein